MDIIQENGKNKLIEDIQQDARMEAEKILGEARTVIAQRNQDAVKKLAALKAEEEKIIGDQVAVIKKNMRSTITVETRRISLKMQEEMFKEIMSGVERDIFALSGTPGYRDILLDWICEAAIGLSASEASVTASARDLPSITPDLLKDAEKKALELTGRKIGLKKTDGDPCTAQGVVLTSQNGKLAFNNCVPTRILRNQLEIRKIIHQKLSKEGKAVQ